MRLGLRSLFILVGVIAALITLATMRSVAYFPNYIGTTVFCAVFAVWYQPNVFEARLGLGILGALILSSSYVLRYFAEALYSSYYLNSRTSNDGYLFFEDGLLFDVLFIPIATLIYFLPAGLIGAISGHLFQLVWSGKNEVGS